jgi:hypothetical protein
VTIRAGDFRSLLGCTNEAVGTGNRRSAVSCVWERLPPNYVLVDGEWAWARGCLIAPGRKANRLEGCLALLFQCASISE